MCWVPACVAAALLSTPAFAAPPAGRSYRVTFRAAAGCPSESAVVSDVVAHVHDDSRARGARVDLSIDTAAHGYVGTLVASDERGEEGARRIEGSTCIEVAHALAFLAGLAIDLGGRIEPAPTTPPPAKHVGAPSPARPAPAPKPVRSIDVALVVLEDARGGLGPGARTGADFGVDIGVQRGVLAPSVRVAGILAHSEVGRPASASAPEAAAGAELWLVGGRLEVCPFRFGVAAFAVRPCLGGELGVARGQGQISVDPRRVTELWASAETTVRAAWSATRSLFVELAGGPVFPVYRTRYYFQPDATLYSVPAVTARASLGIGVTF